MMSTPVENILKSTYYQKIPVLTRDCPCSIAALQQPPFSGHTPDHPDEQNPCFGTRDPGVGCDFLVSRPHSDSLSFLKFGRERRPDKFLPQDFASQNCKWFQKKTRKNFSKKILKKIGTFTHPASSVLGTHQPSTTG
jgi:hypothetical protein